MDVPAACLFSGVAMQLLAHDDFVAPAAAFFDEFCERPVHDQLALVERSEREQDAMIIHAKAATTVLVGDSTGEGEPESVVGVFLAVLEGGGYVFHGGGIGGGGYFHFEEVTLTLCLGKRLFIKLSKREGVSVTNR